MEERGQNPPAVEIIYPVNCVQDSYQDEPSHQVEMGEVHCPCNLTWIADIHNDLLTRYMLEGCRGGAQADVMTMRIVLELILGQPQTLTFLGRGTKSSHKT